MLTLVVANTNRQIQRRLKIVARVELFDGNRIVRPGGIHATEKNGLQHANRWLQAEVDLLPIEFGLNLCSGARVISR